MWLDVCFYFFFDFIFITLCYRLGGFCGVRVFCGCVLLLDWWVGGRGWAAWVSGCMNSVDSSVSRLFVADRG